MIPYGRQSINQEDIDAVIEVLRSDFLTQGPMVPQFENRLASYSGASHAVAVSSGTSALHLACLALDLGPGDVLWTSPITFVASANCARYCGADVDFVDIDPRTYNLAPAALEAKLEVAERDGGLPKVIVTVHMCGQSCDMAAIRGLAERYGVRVIEDAAHALGGRYRNTMVGSARYSDVVVFSFHPVKVIATGEGGAAMTNDQELADRMARLRSHGITRERDRMTRPPDGPWYYEQLDLGLNYRLTDLQAALGVSQMDRLEEFVARRRDLARRYDERLEGLPVRTPWQDPRSVSAHHIYVVRLREGASARALVFDALRARGIGVNVHYIPVHLQPYYRALGFSEGDFPESERYYAEAITLPLYPGLTEADQDLVVDALREAVRR